MIKLGKIFQRFIIIEILKYYDDLEGVDELLF